MASMVLDSLTRGRWRAQGVVLSFATICAACAADEPTSLPSGSASTSSTSGSTGAATSEPASTGDPADTTADSSTGAPPVLCEDPQPILQRDLDVPTGYEQCADGQIQRVEAVTCEVPKPLGGCFDGAAGSQCLGDDECTDRPFGTCVEIVGGPGISCQCRYGCETDADCSEGLVCACGGDAPGYPRSTHCVPAACTHPLECPGGLCRFGGHSHTCERNYRTACTATDDPCTFDDDCEDPQDQSCYPIDDQWQCDFGGCL